MKLLSADSVTKKMTLLD